MFFWCSFVFCVFGFVTSIDVIEPSGVWGTDPIGIFVSWNLIFYNSKRDISGYKVKLWTVKMNSEKKIDLVNADQYPGWVQDDITLEEMNSNVTLNDTPREFTVNGNCEKKIHITDDIQYNVVYELRLLAFKDEHNGPMSKPRRIKIVKGDGYHAIIQKLSSGCLVSVPSVLHGNDEDYTHAHDNFF